MALAPEDFGGLLERAVPPACDGTVPAFERSLRALVTTLKVSSEAVGARCSVHGGTLA
jgi:hypothetical protein